MINEIIENLEAIVGEKWVDTDPERVRSYSLESTNDNYSMVAPEPVAGSVIVKAADSEEIADILKFANKEKINVIARGAGTALSANTIPDQESIILSLERMDKIIEVDEENMLLKAEAAVSLGDIIEELKSSDHLYFPLHPGDEGAQVGGMAAMNAGGVRAVKHGIMRNQILGMEVVLPTGEIVHYGGSIGKLLKNNAGYDLMQLLIGSEGTLGVITEVSLKLYPEPEANGTLIVAFNDRKDAFAAVPAILKRGIIPMALEYVEKDEIQLAAADIGKKWPAEQGEYFLIIMLSEAKEDDLFEIGARIDQITAEFNPVEMLIAQSISERKDILDIRSHILPAISDKFVDSPDVTVPRGSLLEYLEKLTEIEEKYNTKCPVIAHAGDGNLHVLILKDEGAKPSYFEEIKKDIYQSAVDMGGTITGEHGIGKLRQDYLPMMYSERELEIMKQIKNIFDPNNILNAGKSI
ncbi:glycolate oxidase [Halanaerobium saccharolyticum]|uniref:Glycolate oxidase n=1 Tax=Halanaerobium saccharolyticum TaxID=43595 RepID=A0A4R7YN17_9FIRM|nr:FAD-binding oxidoreductase [Halanaerobium saccharolyticum]RAK05056.1 glycolate oxidase [Halanaerobium saccharolyticum]TDV98842.1 glycolate oxidase [Halanaerobium saccharolyticum]TDX51493.1 glycolate oxidase [Halanaerobium saccharolyticum]